jgi:myo-inositol 2-dehydrogenase/D-chiro-inositol 1-dehydrogenase
VSAGLDENLPLRSADPTVTFPSGKPWHFFMDRFAAAFRTELGAFTDVVAGVRSSPCTVHDAVQASLVAEAATRSQRERRPVLLEEIG